MLDEWMAKGGRNKKGTEKVVEMERSLSEIYVEVRVSRKLIVDSSYVCGRFVSFSSWRPVFDDRVRRYASATWEKLEYETIYSSAWELPSAGGERQDFSRNRAASSCSRVISFYRDPRYVSRTLRGWTDIQETAERNERISSIE